MYGISVNVCHTCESAQRPEGVSCEPLDVGVRNQTWKQVPLTTDISAAQFCSVYEDFPFTGQETQSVD